MMYNLKGWKVFIDTEKINSIDNMKKDKELFESYQDGDLPIFRLYFWEKSWTCGVSQQIDKINFSYGTGGANRITGGGILLHGHDISYSIIYPVSLLKNKNVKETYEYFCQFIMNFYESVGLKPNFAKKLKEIKLSKNNFCQIGFEPYDIIVNGKKIGGNAQKRTKNKIIQHGSIPFKKINHPKGGYSLEDFGISLSEDEIIYKIIKSFRKIYVKKTILA